MRRITLTLIALLALAAAPCAAVETRTLDGSHPAAEIEVVSLDAGIGDVEVVADAGDEVRWTVVLKPRRGGLFASLKAGEKDVREARVVADLRRGELRLEVETDSRDRRFEERWTIHMPAATSFELDLGVGDLRARGLAGGVAVDAGVGDLTVEVEGGRVQIDAGVGDVTVRAPARAYAAAEATAGVGDASVRVGGRRVEDGGFLGSEASWSGDGEHTIRIEVGVGDASIILDE